MINRTRITVDEATREVLDQLSNELSKVPSWSLQLGEEIRQALDDALHEGEAKQAKAFESLKSTSHALQSQVVEQGGALTALGLQLQNLAERAETFGSDLTMQTGSLSRLAGAIERVEKHSIQQAQDFGLITDSLNKFAEFITQSTNMAAKQCEEIAALRDLCSSVVEQQSTGQAKLTDAFQRIVLMQQEICSEQVVQRDLIEQPAFRIDRLSQPWWRRLFSSRSTKS
jgi:predicted  nucleic acid-binding Zn-ribbon protein